MDAERLWLEATFILELQGHTSELPYPVWHDVIKHVLHEKRLDFRVSTALAVPPGVGKVKNIKFLNIELGGYIEDFFYISRYVFVEVFLTLVFSKFLERESFHGQGFPGDRCKAVMVPLLKYKSVCARLPHPRFGCGRALLRGPPEYVTMSNVSYVRSAASVR